MNYYAVPPQFLCRYPICIFNVMVGQGTFHTEEEREEHEIAVHAREDVGWVGGKPLGASRYSNRGPYTGYYEARRSPAGNPYQSRRSATS